MNFKRSNPSNRIKLTCFLIVMLALVNCKEAKETIVPMIALTNNSDIELSQKAVAVDRALIDREKNSKGFPLLTRGSDTIPSQVNDLDGDGVWDELFLVTDFAPREKKSVALHWVDEAPSFPVRTSVRFGKRETENTAVKPAMSETFLANEVHKALGFQKYQTDGPTWENDKVGFRHYFDGRNAKDLFGKKTPGITPEDVGLNEEGAVVDNYHEMHDWGRDIFPVGNSAGLGGFALLVGDEINRLGIIATDTVSNIEKTSFEIVSEGPENSVMRYTYNNWEASGNMYQAHETTSIWPGMYGFKNTVTLDGLKGDEMLLIGLSNINNQNPLNVVESGNFVCLIQHDYLTYERTWVLGTALLVPKKEYKGYMEAPEEGQLTDTYLAKMKVNNREPVSYYAIAGWELSADKNFIDATYFNDYVVDLAGQLSVEISVEIEQ